MGFSQSRLSNQFLTWEDGGELLFLILGFVYDLMVWRGIGIIDAFISLLLKVFRARPREFICFNINQSSNYNGGRTGAQFRPPNSFRFPKREFGSKRVNRSFRADWCQQFEWLRYDVGADAAS